MAISVRLPALQGFASGKPPGQEWFTIEQGYIYVAYARDCGHTRYYPGDAGYAALRCRAEPLASRANAVSGQFASGTYIDLIYGLPGQTVASWLQSLETALRYQPEKLYLYPFYVRPLIGLGRRGNARKEGDSRRLACYHAGRELLLARGYTQISMRMFRAFRVHEETGPVYCAQEDGMLGLGCRARSYTTAYQYASEYAVGASGIRATLQHYLARPAESFAYAHYGFHLDGEEQRRRQLITSLFDTGGIDPVHYQQRFKSEILSDFPAFQQLLDLRLVESKHGLLQLTAKGLAYSDSIGPWLYSQRVQTLMKDYQLQ